MIKAVIFDLDETLYDEMQFVKSGFRAVSLYMANKNDISADKFYKLLVETLGEFGRGKIFDIALRKLKLFEKILVFELVKAYRNHKPVLSLYSEVNGILAELVDKSYKLGLITDGNVDVQKNKVAALGIGDIFACKVFSDEYGINKQKPDSFPYEKALKDLATKPQESIYIGDNPHKDFITARKLGMHTIRIMRGQHRRVALGKEYEADFQMKKLDDILVILEQINKNDEKVCCNRR